MNSGFFYAELAGGIARPMFSRRELLKRGGDSGSSGSGSEEGEPDNNIIYLIVVLGIILAIIIISTCYSMCASFCLPYGATWCHTANNVPCELIDSRSAPYDLTHVDHKIKKKGSEGTIALRRPVEKVCGCRIPRTSRARFINGARCLSKASI
jgi:hypothetical protein